MTKTILIILLHLILPVAGLAQSQNASSGQTTYQNPILAGDYPDPSLLRDGKNYYMVHSSFEYYPGLTIWQSKDLINWEPLTNALDHYVGDVWAPDLVKYNNKYYIYFPANKTNFVITADNMSGPWSEPVDLKIGHIDPGHIEDDKGNRYLYFNSGDYIALSRDGLRTVGNVKHAYDGWPIPREWSIECFCMEGPKLFKKDDYYYLTVAQGGTAGPATSHMVVSARSKTPFGPWENSPFNPVVHTKSADEKWWSKGHSTVFEDAEGKWWMVLHGYQKGFYNLGRQTLLLPVEWTRDGWYKIPDGIRTEDKIQKPAGNAVARYSLDDDFSGNILKPQWKFLGALDESRFKAQAKGLSVKAKGNTAGESGPLVCVPQGHSYMAEVELEIQGSATGGLLLFYDKSHFSGILADKEDILTNALGYQYPTEKKAHNRHVYLRLKNLGNTVDMFYSLDGKEWTKTQNSVEVSAYNHNILGGFLGLRIALCSFGEGEVRFRNFKYLAL